MGARVRGLRYSDGESGVVSERGQGHGKGNVRDRGIVKFINGHRVKR